MSTLFVLTSSISKDFSKKQDPYFLYSKETGAINSLVYKNIKLYQHLYWAY